MNDKSVQTESQQKQSNKGNGGDSFPLIETKYNIPHRRSDLLIRPRLVNFLHAHLDRKLIIVSAPAGYGKTALLVDFASDTDLPVCWYTLDPFDKDLRVFLEYLIASISHKFPKFGARSKEVLQQITDPANNLYPVVATMVQEINDTIPEYFVIVLDDHHTVEDQNHINDFIDLFVTYADENCHLVLASRSLPALPNISLLIARQQAIGLGIDELRFTAGEIQEFALQKHKIKISIQQAESISHRTGGWVTGLQLTRTSQWEQTPEKDSLGQYDHHIFDYLLKQVLNQQPVPLQKFLLESAVLDEINTALCSSVLGIEDAGDYIDQLRVRNLFITEYEGTIDRIRFHDLFRHFLITTSQRKDNARFKELTLAAADYYAGQGEWDRAISRYQSLGDHKSVAEILDSISIFMFDTGRWNTLSDWIDALPDSYLEKFPNILIYRAKIHTERGEQTAAINLFDRAEQAFSGTANLSKAAQALAMKGVILRFQGHYSDAIAQCQQAFALVKGKTPEEKYATALAHKNIGLSLIRLGQLSDGKQSLNRALYIYEELANSHDIGMIHHDLGLSLELTGDLEGAINHYSAALENWKQLGNLSPWANTLNGLGVVYFQKGEYELAKSTLEEALQKAQQAKDQRIEAYTLASLGDLYRDTGKYNKARQVFENALEIAHRTHTGFVVTYALDGLGNVTRLQGDSLVARNRLHEAREHAINHDSAFEIGLCNTSLGILANEESDLNKAAKYLDPAIETLESSGFVQQLSRAFMHRGYTSYLMGDKEESIELLEKSISLSDQIGYEHYLTLDALQVRPLIEYAQKQSIRTLCLDEILARVDSLEPQENAQVEPSVQIEVQPALKITAFGKPQVILDEQKVQWSVAKSRDLFFFLLQNPNGQNKEQIGTNFWPEHGPERLDAAFRSTLYRLRRVVFRDSVVFEDGLYRFNWSSDYLFDVQRFEVLHQRAKEASSPEKSSTLLAEALSLYSGEYLEGVYHDWAETERTQLHSRYISTMGKLAGLYADQRKLQQAIELYQRLVNNDKFNETAYRSLMDCYYRQGDRATAIRYYHTCVEMLRDELDLTPSEETEKLYMQIIS